MKLENHPDHPSNFKNVNFSCVIIWKNVYAKYLSFK